MSQLTQLLQQYRELAAQLAQLETHKRQLRDTIQTLIQQEGKPVSVILGDVRIRARVKTSVKVTYDEEGLRRRLGDRCRMVLEPDVTKMRDHMKDIRPLLDPVIDKIGSVSRELVQHAIESGTLRSEDFAGLFDEEIRETLYIHIDPMENGSPHQPGHGSSRT